MLATVLSFGASFNDDGVKNKFQWGWLQSAHDGEPLSNWLRKTEEPGMCLCVRCNKHINYGSAGKKAYFQHAKTKLHQDRTASAVATIVMPGEALVAANQHVAVSDQVTRSDLKNKLNVQT